MRSSSSVVRRGFAVIWMAIREQPQPFTVAVVGASVFGGMTVASAWVFGRVTDLVVMPAFETGQVRTAALVLAAGAIVGVGTLKAAGVVVRRMAASYMQLQLEATYRRRVTRQYQRLPLSWHRRHPTGELLSNANADVEATFYPIAPLPFSVGVVVMLLLTAVALILTDVYLTLLGLLMGPAMALVNWRYNRRMEAPATRAQQRRADVSAVAHESFEGALVVKTLGREAAESRRFAAESARLRDDLVELGRIRAVFDPVMEALPQTAILAVLLVGAWRVSVGDLSPGVVVQFGYLFGLLAFPMRVIGYFLGELPRSVVGWERVARVLEATGEVPYGDLLAGQRSGPAEIDLAEVTFHYEDTDEPVAVLSDVTLRMPRGRVVAITGPTGSGKSTVASLLVRLADPQSGAVRLDGRDLRDLAPGVVSGSASIVFQHSFLFDDTVRENVTLGRPFTDEQVEAACRLAQIHDFVTTLPQGYDTLVGERGTSLSGGQRQRVALARALVGRPRLLILDDATSSVDPAVEAAILHGLRTADLPSTIVLIAYRPASIALADEVIYVERGRVVARGTHAELLARVPAYARMLTAYDHHPKVGKSQDSLTFPHLLPGGDP